MTVMKNLIHHLIRYPMESDVEELKLFDVEDDK